MLFSACKRAKAGCLSVGLVVCVSFGYNGRNLSL